MERVARALAELGYGLGHLTPEQRLRSRRFLPTAWLDQLGAAVNVYQAAVDLDVKMRQAAEAVHPERVEGGIESLRDLALTVDREGRIALRYLEESTGPEQGRAQNLNLPTTIDLDAIWAVRRGVEVRADLVDVGALAALTSRLRSQVDVRMFAVSRLSGYLSTVPAPGNAPVRQFAYRLSDALALPAHPARSRSSRIAGADPVGSEIDTVRTLLDNVEGLDLRDVDLYDVPLLGVLWSSATRWPPGLRKRIEEASVPVGNDQFKIIDWDIGRAASAVTHMPKLA